MSGSEKSIDPRIAERITPELISAIEEKAADGKITCAMLRKLAEELGLPYCVAGAAADQSKIKVKSCDLGCF